MVLFTHALKHGKKIKLYIAIPMSTGDFEKKWYEHQTSQY
jgi:hypothetical protein